MLILTNSSDKIELIINLLIKKNINFDYCQQFSYYDFYKDEFSGLLNIYHCIKVKKKIFKTIINEIKALNKDTILFLKINSL